MKILSKLSVIACLCWATLASCESPDYETGRTAQVNGLMSLPYRFREIHRNLQPPRLDLMKKMKRLLLRYLRQMKPR